jgi:hypothetical protein
MRAWGSPIRNWPWSLLGSPKNPRHSWCIPPDGLTRVHPRCGAADIMTIRTPSGKAGVG